jgi:hypothetical protein
VGWSFRDTRESSLPRPPRPQVTRPPRPQGTRPPTLGRLSTYCLYSQPYAEDMLPTIRMPLPPMDQSGRAGLSAAIRSFTRSLDCTLYLSMMTVLEDGGGSGPSCTAQYGWYPIASLDGSQPMFWSARFPREILLTNYPTMGIRTSAGHSLNSRAST